MTAEQAWDELLQITGQSVPKRVQLGGSESEIRWLRPNRLAMSGKWPVQARFVAILRTATTSFVRKTKATVPVGHQFSMPKIAGG